MDPSRNQLLHLSEGEDDSEEEEESFGFQQCRRRKGAMQNQEMQRVNKLKRGGKGDVNGGGRIVRATGRKDRHSKVSTARGTRDRRVRLSPNTAIQFYDVQDRLGYDRPSKAIDWLMKEAKAEIEALNNSATPLPQQQQQQSSPVFPLEQQFLNSSVFPLENSVNNQQNPVSSQDNIFFFDWNAPNPENNPQSFTNFTHFPPVFSQREPLQSSFSPMGFASINNELSSLSGTRRIHGENTEEQNLSSTSILDYQH